MVRAVRRESEELARSKARGVTDAWAVMDDYQVRTLAGEPWLCHQFVQRRVYAPLEHPELPHHFARLADAHASVLLFAQQFGHLGRDTLRRAGNRDRDILSYLGDDAWERKVSSTERRHVQPFSSDPELRFEAEPVQWIRIHAQTVGWCLKAGRAMQTASGLRRRRACDQLVASAPAGVGLRSGISRADWLADMPWFDVAGAESDQVVGEALAFILGVNISGVTRDVRYEGGVLRATWGPDVLLESVYSLVADAATGGRLGQCDSCGAVFVKTDERQRFCPPLEGQEKSRCMNRERVARYRQIARDRAAKAKRKRGGTR